MVSVHASAANPHAQGFTIPTSAVGATATLRLSALLSLLQELASSHATQLGVGYDAMLAHQRAFMLSRIQLAFDGPWPVWGDSLTVETWPRGIERLIALREFRVRRADGSIFARGSTGWAVVDTARTRIVRPEEVIAHLQPDPTPALDAAAPARLKWHDAAQAVDVRTARPSDLDPHRHVNNTRYGDWIADAVALRHGLDAQIRALAINYLTQVLPGESVAISVAEPAPGMLVVQGSVEGEGEARPRRTFAAAVQLAGSPMA